MNPAIVGAVIIGGIALLSRNKAQASSVTTDAGDVEAEVKRIVAESKEIVQGKRDAYSDDPSTKVSAREAAERTKAVIDRVKANTHNTSKAAEDALAIEAARLAAKQERDGREAARAYGQHRVEQGSPVAPAPRPAPIFATKPKPIGKNTTAPDGRRPEGYDATKAKNAAEGLARHIKKTNYNYERKALQAWQRAAGIAQDGVYGPTAANALKYFTALAPKKLFAKGKDGKPYANVPYPPPNWS